MIQRHCLITIFIYNGPVKYFKKIPEYWHDIKVVYKYLKEQSKVFLFYLFGGKYFFGFVYLFVSVFFNFNIIIFCGKHLFDYPGSLF